MNTSRGEDMKLSDGIYLVVTQSMKTQDSARIGGKVIIKIGEVVDMRDLICFDCYERDYCYELCDHFWIQREMIFQEMLLRDGEILVFDEMFDVLAVRVDNKVEQIELNLENSK